MSGTPRLDALDLAFFERELRAVDARAFEEKLAGLNARSFIPTLQGLGEGTTSYEYHMFKHVGKAKYAARDGVTDAPRAEVTGKKFSRSMEPIVDGYGYSIWEIMAAAKAGRPLDAMRAVSARRALEQLIDESWAYGNADLGHEGLLTLSDAKDFTTGSGAWGDLDAADPDKVYADICGIVSFAMQNTQGAFTRFNVLLPIAEYNVAAQLRFGAGSDMTVLKAALANCPYLAGVDPWYRCAAASSGGVLAKDLMVAYPKDEMVVAGLVRDVNFLAPQEKGYRFEVPAYAETGGVICRYPVAVATSDDIT